MLQCWVWQEERRFGSMNLGQGSESSGSLCGTGQAPDLSGVNFLELQALMDPHQSDAVPLGFHGTHAVFLVGKDRPLLSAHKVASSGSTEKRDHTQGCRWGLLVSPNPAPKSAMTREPFMPLLEVVA